MIKYFWCSHIQKRGKGRVYHQIKDVVSEETEAGTDGEKYIARCGDFMLSWWYPRHSRGLEPKFGNVNQAIKDGASLCEKCKAAREFEGLAEGI